MPKATASKAPTPEDIKKAKAAYEADLAAANAKPPQDAPPEPKVRSAKQNSLREMIYASIIQGDIAAGMLDELQEVSKTKDAAAADKLFARKIENAVKMTDRYLTAFDA